MSRISGGRNNNNLCTHKRFSEHEFWNKKRTQEKKILSFVPDPLLRQAAFCSLLVEPDEIDDETDTNKIKQQGVHISSELNKTEMETEEKREVQVKARRAHAKKEECVAIPFSPFFLNDISIRNKGVKNTEHGK